MSIERITLAGGCFWCLEAVFKQLRGVLNVESGYANGQLDSPSYEQVCSGETGHAEVVLVEFDPDRIGLATILGIFFAVHDPTTLNRQGNDVGTQYRSGIYYHHASQEAVARDLMAQLNLQKIWKNPLVTEVEPLRCYFPAETYHQSYYENNPDLGYCAFVVGPKVAKFRKQFSTYLEG
jgi:peptide-methionine (S)-S-oxide reductase